MARPGAAEPYGWPETRTVRMINCLRGSVNLEFIAMNEVLNNTANDEVVYYHSTTSDYAKDILKHGIDLTKSRLRQDFSNGNGFYVMKDINRAIKWANKRASGGTGAIIAFKISRNLEKEEPHLSLEVQTQEGRALWTKIVTYFRKGGISSDVPLLVQGQKFISGPAGKANTTPYDFTQTCILDPEYAKRYGRLENISFVMFIG